MGYKNSGKHGNKPNTREFKIHLIKDDKTFMYSLCGISLLSADSTKFFSKATCDRCRTIRMKNNLSERKGE